MTHEHTIPCRTCGALVVIACTAAPHDEHGTCTAEVDGEFDHTICGLCEPEPTEGAEECPTST